MYLWIGRPMPDYGIIKGSLGRDHLESKMNDILGKKT